MHGVPWSHHGSLVQGRVEWAGRRRRCVAYTFAVRSGTCYLKDRIGRRENDRDKVSGTREGY